MPDSYEIVVCALQFVSTIGIFKLLAYTIVRYCTNERGGIHTGFTSAGIVMVISGMCLYCSLLSMERFVIIYSEEYYTSMTKSLVMEILQNLLYLFSICWVNAICLVVTEKTVSMKVPKRNIRVKDFGFNNSKFYKWLPYTIIIPTFYGISTATVYIVIEKGNSTVDSTMGAETDRFYSIMTFYIISGICVSINMISLAIFFWFMNKTYLRLKNKVSVWKKIPRSLKSAIKCNLIIAFMWIIDLISWLINTAFPDNEQKTASIISKLFQIIYSLQGLTLFFVVFFYRSKQDQNPVIAAVRKSLVRTTEGNVDSNAGVTATNHY